MLCFVQLTRGPFPGRVATPCREQNEHFAQFARAGGIPRRFYLSSPTSRPKPPRARRQECRRYYPRRRYAQGLARQYRAMKYFVKVEAAGAVLRNLDKITCRGVPQSWGLKQPRAQSASRSDHHHAFSCCNQPPPRPAILGGGRYSGGKSPPGVGLDNLAAMCYHVRATTAEAGRPAPPAAPTRPRKRPESVRRHGLTTSAAAL